MSAGGTTRRQLVLVVDDDAGNRRLAQVALETEGFEVELAASGSGALDAFRARQPDCVLLDVRMPDVDGPAVCAAIRSHPRGAHVPVLFLTGHRDVETFDRAKAAGGDEFLTKPIVPSELVLRVRTALRIHRLGAELRDQFDVVRRQRDALMRLQMQKEELTAFLVHDLKNPVTAVDLHAQLALRVPGVPPAVRDGLQQIRGEAETLVRMIMNLLDVSRSEEADLEIEPAAVDLGALIDEVFDTLRAKAIAAGVALERHVAAERVEADRDLIARVLENLVDNAVRYAPEGSVVEVRTEPAGAEVEVRVRDAGRGIPEELRGLVFDRYAQIEARAQSARTSRGLGLAFCRIAIEAHGGRIWIEGAEPGTVFCLRIPASAAARPAERAAGA